MFKSAVLTLRGYQTYLKSSLKSCWYLIPVLLSASLFAALTEFEAEVAGGLMGWYDRSINAESYFFIDMVRLVAREVLWACFFFLLSGVLWVHASSTTLAKIFELGSSPAATGMIVPIIGLFLFLTLYTAAQTLEAFPNSASEHVYLFQAELFSEGRLWAPAHDLRDFFYHTNIIQHDGVLVSRFAPGWPVFLSPAFGAGFPAYLVNPLLGIITLILFYYFAVWMYGDKVAIWALLAVAFSGFFIFHSASYHPHLLSLLVTLLFVCNVYLYRRKGTFIYGLLAGFFLSFIALIRYDDALFVLLPFLGYFVYEYRLRALRLFVLMAIGALPLVAFLLSYHYAITGSAFFPVAVWAGADNGGGGVHWLGFPEGVTQALKGVVMFSYWCSPGLLILYVVFLFRKIAIKEERFQHPPDYYLLMLIAGDFLFSRTDGGVYGPGYLFIGFPFLALFVVAKTIQSGEKWAMALLVASLVFAIAKFPGISQREEAIADERQDLYDLVKEERIGNAVVLISSSTGRMRPLAVEELTRNDRMFQNDVIFARDLPKITGQLLEYYSDRQIYRYVRPPNEIHGHLVRVR